MLSLHRDLPCFCHFICISGTNQHEIRHRAQRRKLFNGLMRRTVFAQADRIVSENKDDRRLHQRSQADRRTLIIAEIKEGPTERQKPRNRHAIQCSSHGVFAYAEMNVSPLVLRWREIASTLQVRLVGVAQVRRAADQPGNILRKSIHDLPAALTRGDTLRVCWKYRKTLIPIFWKLALLDHP